MDQARVAYGVRTMLNFVAEVGGAASNRPGTEYLGTTDTGIVRLRSFLTGISGNFLLEWREHAVRVWQDGSPYVATGPWSFAITYARGDRVIHNGFGYISRVDGNSNHDPDLETYTNGYSSAGWWFRTAIQTGSAFNMEDWIPTRDPIYGIAFTPTHYQDFRAAQNDTEQIIVHRLRVPRRLRRDTQNNNHWLIDPISFVPQLAGPGNMTASGSAGGNAYSYKVTAFRRSDREESLSGVMATLTVTAVTAATPRAVTFSASHGMRTGDEVLIDGTGLADIDGMIWTIASTGAATCTLNGSGGAGTSAIGTGIRQQASILGAAAPTPSAPHTITWDTVSGADSYVIYKELNGVFGFIGVASGNDGATFQQFQDIGYTPDTSDTPPIDDQPFDEADGAGGGLPSVVAFFQQRLVFGATDNDPQGVKMSRTGRLFNFTVSEPIKDDDAVSFTIASSQTRKINALVEIGRLLALTAGAEWSIDGDGDGAITPTSIRARQQTYDGAEAIEPLPVGAAALYVGDRSNSVREISFNELSQGERSRNLITWSEHLLDGYTVIEWAHQRVPDSIVWAVRSDGILLGMTYEPAQEVIAWHRHDVGGLVRSVCVIPEADRDVLYLVVEREVDGNTVQYIERLGNRRFDDIVDACFLDSSIVWDGQQTSTTTITATTAGGWTVDDDLTLTASASIFVAGDVDQAYRLAAGDDTLLVVITGYTSTTVVTGRAVATVPPAFQGVATSGWARARNYIEGLDHLEGETVGILADGFVGAQAVVASGRVDLSTHAVVIRAGLPYVSRLETLEMENPDGETLLDKQMRVSRVGLLLHETRGAWVGSDVDNMKEWKHRAQGGDTSQPIDLFTGLAEVSIGARYTKGGKVVVEQRDPLPMRITGIIRVGEIGGN